MTIWFWFLHFRNIDLGIKSFLNYPASLSNKFQAVAKHVSMIVFKLLYLYKSCRSINAHKSYSFTYSTLSCMKRIPVTKVSTLLEQNLLVNNNWHRSVCLYLKGSGNVQLILKSLSIRLEKKFNQKATCSLYKNKLKL